MLLEASTTRLPWTASPLHLSAQESFWIGRLLFFRDSFEHPKQLTFVMTKVEVADAIEGSVEVTHRALRTITHQIYDQLDLLAELVNEIQKLAGEMEAVEA